MVDRLNDQLEFEENIRKMDDRELLEFTARQVYSVRELCPLHEKRLKVLEDIDKHDKRRLSLSGSVGGLIAGGVVALLDYFSKRG